MNYKYIITILLTSFVWKLNAQSNIDVGLNTCYLKSGNLIGLGIASDFIFGSSNHRFLTGFDFNYGENNRNFDKDLKNNSIEYNGYYPNYQFFPSPTFQYEDTFELPVKTTQLYQMTIKFGYRHVLDNLSLTLGIYGTKVNLQQIAYTMQNIEIHQNQNGLDYNASLNIPVQNNYLDIGQFIGIKYMFKNNKYPIGISTNYFHANKTWWVNLGVSCQLNLTSN